MESHNNNESLLEDNNNTNKSDSFMRSSTFIPTNEVDSTQDERALIEMGFEKRMIKKVYLFLKPRNINEAIEFMSDLNGIYQHDFYNSINENCFICKKGKEFHRDFNSEDNVYIPVNDNKIQLEGVNIIKKIEENYICLICFDSFSESEIIKFPCGHTSCEQCIYQYLKTEISNAKITTLKCFYERCPYVLKEQLVINYLQNDKNLIEKYTIFKQRAEIFNSKDKKFCPEPDCNSYLQESDNKYVQCEHGHKYCYICLKPWHGDKNCDEELDKDFQIWKKDKVVKQCPRCKIYTEKNEGCNHMTCTECKYQWCWLCERKYTLDHFRTGECNGLQFVKINFLSEKPKNVRVYNENHPIVVHERHNNPEDRQKGCCCCNRNIVNKYWFVHTAGLLNWYYGNKLLMFLVTLFTMFFLSVPVVAIALIYDIADVYFNYFKPIHNLFIILIAISLFICYQFTAFCLFFIGFIISSTFPFRKLNLAIFIYDKSKNSYTLNYY